jgi:hypothetical protein
MNHKIIETNCKLPDVLLYRHRNEDGDEQVIIQAIGTIDDTDNTFAQEPVTFDNEYSAQRFITDYSKTSAELWCKQQAITY